MDEDVKNEIERLTCIVMQGGDDLMSLIGIAANETSSLNERRGKLQMELAVIGKEMDAISRPYEDKMKPIHAKIAESKLAIAELMTTAEEKTVDLFIATVTMKTTKSVTIKDNVGLVAELVKIKDGVEKGVKAFTLPHIRKLMDVGIVDPKLAEYTEKQTVYIKAKESPE